MAGRGRGVSADDLPVQGGRSKPRIAQTAVPRVGLNVGMASVTISSSDSDTGSSSSKGKGYLLPVMMATETVTATVMVMEEAGLLNRSLLERVWAEEQSEASQSRWPFTEQYPQKLRLSSQDGS
ncbi:uncharacterized protein LOC111696352 [Eurytemora carolleeae]|uniref:uncharacterized protein LOC111696352 n=1 Tax=Eurytemora carolleeae TaxID=1294199 RepID=UPI000C764854|nr:uncharacterized protein LOC111696352 [Eurytemora carolleeae]|eukprot:XP_023321710.1 uncharacterized protein LOC111696352 [Eurytemora affinis]